MPIDNDGTPGTLKLRGDAAASLIAEQNGTRILAFSSTADSVYLMILGNDKCRPAPDGCGGGRWASKKAS